MKNWGLLLGLLFLSTQLFAQDPLDPFSDWSPIPGKRTVIKGEIKDPGNDQFQLSLFKNLLSFAEEDINLALDEKNRFNLDFSLKVPAEFTLTNGEENVHLYLEPGDSLFLYFDAQQFPQAIYVGGRGSSHNKFLLQFQSIFSSFNINQTFQRFVNQEPAQFKRFLTKEWERRLTFYRDYSSTESVSFSKAFHGFMQADIHYWRALNLLLFRHEYNIIGGKTSDRKLPFSYFDFLEAVTINNDYALYNSNYAYFLDQYLKFVLEHPQRLPEKVLIPVHSDAIVLSKPEDGFVMEEVPKGIPLKYLEIRSDEPSRFFVDNTFEQGYWYKVATPLGNSGWIQGVGLEFDTLFVQTDTDEDVSLTTISSTYLRGAARDYAMAYDLFWRMAISIPGDYSSEVAAFLNQCKLEYLKENIAVAYRNRQLKKDIIGCYSILDASGQREHLLVDSPQVGQNNWFAYPESHSSEEEFVQKGLEKEIRTSAPPKSGGISLLSRELAKKNPKVWKDLDWVNTAIPKTALLRGALLPGTKTPVLRLHADPITLSQKEYTLEVQADQTVTQRLTLNYTKSGKLEIGELEIPVLIRPGDDLAFNMLPNGAIEFIGEGATINNYFVQETKKFKSLDNQVKKAIENKEPEAFKLLLNEARIKKLKFLKQFQLQHDLSIREFEYAKGAIDYWYGYELLNYPYEHPLYHGMASPISVPQSYYDELESILISQSNALPNPYYTYFLDQYFEFIKRNGGAIQRDDELFLKEFLRGESFYFYRAKQLSNYCRRGKGLDKGKEIQQFLDECPYPQYSEVLYQSYQANRGFNAGDQAPVFQLEDLGGEFVSIDQFAGKVVYLDFWATWCQPCVFEMKNSGSWKNEFTGEEVVFVYVSLDRDERAWRKFLTENNIPGEHLIVSSSRGFQDAVPKSYKVKRLPAKFVIDPEGNIAFYPELKTTGVKVIDVIKTLTKS